MVSLITQSELQALLAAPDGIYVSLFMPTRVAPEERDANRIQLRNLTKEAAQQCADWPDALAPEEIDALLKPANDLAAHGRFWENLGPGLAIFLTPHFVRTYRLPLDFKPLAIVGEQFYLTPLLPLLANNGRFLILALSQDEVRLLEGTRATVEQVELPAEIPQSLAEALRWDDPERQLQWQTGTGNNVPAGGRAAIFHGHGVGQAGERKADLLRFFQIVDRGLSDWLGDDQAPLVLAGVDYALDIFRKANSYPHLVADKAISGNPEHLSAQELHNRAWEIVAPHFQAQQNEAADAFRQLQDSDRAANELAAVVAAAHYGRIASLFVCAGEQRWGRFDEETGTTHVHPAQTPGDVVPPQQVPADGVVAAVYRY